MESPDARVSVGVSVPALIAVNLLHVLGLLRINLHLGLGGYRFGGAGGHSLFWASPPHEQLRIPAMYLFLKVPHLGRPSTGHLRACVLGGRGLAQVGFDLRLECRVGQELDQLIPPDLAFPVANRAFQALQMGGHDISLSGTVAVHGRAQRKASPYTIRRCPSGPGCDSNYMKR